MRVALFLVLLAVVATTSFIAGQWYGVHRIQAAPSKSFVLSEDMTILDQSGEPSGRLPGGTRIYLVPDPMADRLTRYKLFLQIDDSTDAPPLKRDETRSDLVVPYGLVRLQTKPHPTPTN
jgi:hypothetical protein